MAPEPAVHGEAAFDIKRDVPVEIELHGCPHHGGSEQRQGWAEPEDDEENTVGTGWLVVEALAALFL